MYQCDYCGAQFKEHQTTCPRCGALVRASALGAQPPAAAPSLRAICLKYEGTRNLYLDETINPQRLAAAQQRMRIPAEETVIMLYDDTLLGSNNNGFAVCAGGLYWSNDWANETRRTFLSWPEFAARTLTLDQLRLNLERGDFIGTAGIGDDAARAQLLAMLNEIRAFLQS